MDCRWFQENISRYFEGEMDAGERPAFERHAQACPRCAQLYAEFPRLLNAMRAMPAVRSPIPLSHSFLQEAAPRGSKRHGYMRVLAGLAAAAVLFVGGYALLRSGVLDVPRLETLETERSENQTPLVENGGDDSWRLQIQDSQPPGGDNAEDNGQLYSNNDQFVPKDDPLNTNAADPDATAEPNGGEATDESNTLTVKDQKMDSTQQEITLTVADVEGTAKLFKEYLNASQISYSAETVNGNITLAMTLSGEQVQSLQEHLALLNVPLSSELQPDIPLSIILTPQDNGGA